MGLRVLVTGGAGFIGSHIAELMASSGHSVAVLDNLSTGRRQQVPEKARFFELDITGDIQPAFEEFRPEVVIHQAAQVSVSVSIKEPELDARTNILGSINVIESCRKAGTRKIVYASSAAAYGPLDTLPLREDLIPRPVSGYGTSKYTVEHYLRTARVEWGLEWVALRYSNVYGPRQVPHGEAGVVAIFSNQLIEAKAPTIFGGGELTRDYVFVEDVARANALALDTDLSAHPDPVFNVSTGIQTSTNRIFELIKAKMNSPIDATRGPDRPGDVQHSVLDSAKFRELTGWTPQVDLDEGFGKAAEFFLNKANA